MSRASPSGLFNTRPGELPRVAALFGHQFLIIAALIVLKSLSSALFLKRLDPEDLPYLYIAGAILVSVVVSLTARFIDRVPRRLLVTATALFFTLTLGGFWTVIRGRPPDAVYPALYLWVEVFGTVMTTQFWIFAADVFTGRQGRRLFGIVGSGGLVGGLVGGSLVSLLAEPLGSENLLLVAGGLCVGIPPLVLLAGRGLAIGQSERRARRERYIRASLEYLRAHRYPWLLAAMVFGTVLATTFIDYQFKIFAAEASATDASLARFLGQYNLLTGFLSLAFQLFVTSLVLNRLGVFSAVLLTPLLLIAGTGLTLLSPGLASIFVLKLLDSSLSHSVDLSGKQLLFVPLPDRIAGTLRAFIEGVVGRIGLGVAGVLLLPLAFVLTLPQLSWVTLGVLVVWAGLAVRSRTEYREALQVSLREGGFRPIVEPTARLDRTTLRDLLHALEAGDEGQVLVALEFLEQTEVDIAPYLKRLLEKRSPEVHKRALRLVAEKGGRAAVDVILGTLGDMPADVTAEAVQAVGRLAPEEAAALIRPFLEHQEPSVRGAAIRAVLSDGRWDAHDLAALERFEEMLAGRCGDPELCRVEAARALADEHLREYRYYLLNYLRDGSAEVQRAAILAVGAARERDYLPILLEKTLVRETREAAIKALSEFGEDLLPVLEDAYESADEWRRMRKNIVRIAGEIGTPQAAHFLLSKVQLASSSERYDLIKALNKLRDRIPDISLDPALVQQAVFREAEDYYRNTHYLVQLGYPERTHLLLDALDERRLFATERVSRLLALVYPPAVIFSIYRGVHGHNVRKASNANELLDNLIDRPTIKALILPLFDDLPPERTLEAAEGQFAFVSRTVEAVLEEIVGHSARWLKLCALYFAGSERVSAVRPLLALTAREDADEEARLTAQAALRLLDGELIPSPDGFMQTLVEKVLFLKEVEIFAGLGGEDLTELAGYLKDVTFKEGETIFEEGEQGDALYVIVQGDVNMVNLGRVTETRGPKSTIGELSAVDQGPRTFTAVAGTDVSAYEIGEVELAEILQENAEISRQMLRVLAGRVRRYMQLELKALADQVPHAEPAL